MILRFIVYFERIIARNKRFSFTLLCIFSLFLAWLNIELGSYVIGSFAFLCFLVPMTVLTGCVLFEEENVALRLTFGFAALLAIFAFFGTLIYLAVDFSWPSMLILLIALTFSLSFLNKRTNQNLMKLNNNKSKHQSETEGIKKYAIDTVFILLLLFRPIIFV